MAINKTIYVKDEDVDTWEEAHKISGDKLSQTLTNYLRSYVIEKKSAALGTPEKILLRFREDGLARAKSFYGRWLIPPNKPFMEIKYETNALTGSIDSKEYPYAVATTAKNNVVVFDFLGKPDDSEKFSWGRMRVYSSFEEASNDSSLPWGLIASAMEKMGVEVEELDI